MTFRLLCPLMLCLWLPLTVAASGFEHLDDLAARGFRIGAEARLLGSGEILGSLAPERQLSPASVTKLYLAAAALDRWGPQHRFTTRLVSDGELGAEGVLRGDLILDGGGDPALDTEALWRLVQRLHQSGVRAIEGRLLISQWRFGPVACLTPDRCQTHSRSANAYSAQLSSAGINHGSWCVSVAPGRAPGAPARVTSCDSQTPIVGIDSRVTTGASQATTRLTAERVIRSQGDVMVVRGVMALGEPPRDLYRASSDPAGQTASTLLAMLEQGDIAVRDGAATTRSAPPEAARVLARVNGPPLQEVLLRTLNYSNNFMADMLTLGLVDEPQAGLAQGGAALERFAASLPGHGPLALRSGSGLTAENRTTARGGNALLEAMYHRPSLFPSFVAGLQSPDNGVSRFIRRGSSTFQRHVMLKTGTLNQPVAVRALAGYFRTRRGRWGVFSVLVNGTATTPWLGWSQVLDPLARDLERMIADN